MHSKVDMRMTTKMMVAGLLAGVLAAGLLLSGCGDSPSTGAGVTASTLAGGAASGTTDGPGKVALFNNPVNLTLGPDHNLYVCDFDNNLVRRVTPAGVVSTLTQQANFEHPFGLVFTPDGTLYVQTDGNDQGARDNTTGTIWRIDLTTGQAAVVARDLGRPRGLAALTNGHLVLVDVVAATVRLMDPANGAVTDLAGAAGQTGFADGTGATARFNRPYGCAVTSTDDILVMDQDNNRIRRITMAGVVTTFAGDGTPGYLDGPRLQAQFQRPQAIAIDNQGDIYVSDSGNHRLRGLNAAGSVWTIGGGSVAGFADGPGLQARFFGMEGIAVTPDGSTLYVADGTNGDPLPYNRIRKVALR